MLAEQSTAYLEKTMEMVMGIHIVEVTSAIVLFFYLCLLFLFLIQDTSTNHNFLNHSLLNSNNSSFKAKIINNYMRFGYGAN